ncbi:MAG TPA: thrombospondin type 3 repeat-containing protein [Polyangiaceae bacterium]|nr:thrombospondin type 3 repeat-containing protein [Polyangiaceae bacterium]
MLTSSSRSAFFTAALWAGVFGITTTAHASPEYPEDIERYWRITSLPVSGQGCKLCHSSDLGETGTVVQPFGKTMRAQGLKPEDPSSLYAALGYVTQHSVVAPIVDSDGDGVPDFTEIVQDHTNPNDPASFVEHTPEPAAQGGAAGDSNGGDVGGGGQGANEQPPAPPVFEPPSAAELPPPFVHGCALGPATQRDSAAFVVFVAALTLVRRRARGVARR